MTPKEARIILGDDDPDALEAAKYNLEIYGHQVILAFKKAKVGLDGFETARQQQAQVAVLDRSLIDCSGLAGQELIERCRLSKIPIICISAIGPPSWADRFVSKREHSSSLLETIEKL